MMAFESLRGLCLQVSPNTCSNFTMWVFIFVAFSLSFKGWWKIGKADCDPYWLFQIKSSHPSQNRHYQDVWQVLERMWGKRKCFHWWWKWTSIHPLWKAFLRFLRRLKMELAYDSAILLLDIWPENSMSYYRDICTCVLVAAVFMIARIWNQPQCSSHLNGYKIWYIYKNVISSSIK